MSDSLRMPKRDGSSGTEDLDLKNPIIFVGANGSGKSRLGHWLDDHQGRIDLVHRITAQRVLDFTDQLQTQSLEISEKELMLGTSDENWQNHPEVKKCHKYMTNGRPSLSVTPMLNDYDRVLKVIFGKQAKRDKEYREAGVMKSTQESPLFTAPPESPVEILLKIWDELFPHRKITLDDMKVKVTYLENTYQGREMSDGERVALYLLAQCLCVPSGSIIVIDEPELHLHRSLMNRLWGKIENARQDCNFIYITHDLDFAASHINARKIWVREYNGTGWIWDEVPQDELLPDAVLLEVLGNRKQIIFVEGTKGGLDHQICQVLYSGFHVIPRGSCNKVIESTKAIKENPLLVHTKVFGIIDSDYRPEEEISALQNHDVHTLKVAEIENLLCVEEVVRQFALHQKKNPDEIFDNVKNFVIEILKSEMEIHASRKSAYEIEFQLGKFDNKATGVTALKEALDKLINEIKIDEIHSNNLSICNEIVKNGDYQKALLLINRKGLPSQIASQCGLIKESYKELFIALIEEGQPEILNGIRKYMPILSDAN